LISFLFLNLWRARPHIRPHMKRALNTACRFGLPPEANSRPFRGSTYRRHPPRRPCKRQRSLGILSRPFVPGGDRHDAARGAGRAADRTSALADRSCLAPRRPGKPRAGCGRDRLRKPRAHDDRLSPRARHHSERMDANVCQLLSARTNRSQQCQLTVPWLPGK
jgi:hypothetical protein